MGSITREEAFELLKKYNQDPFHMLCAGRPSAVGFDTNAGRRFQALFELVIILTYEIGFKGVVLREANCITDAKPLYVTSASNITEDAVVRSISIPCSS